jgi:hypothetical protein
MAKKDYLPITSIKHNRTDLPVEQVVTWIEEHYPSKNVILSQKHIAEAMHSLYGIDKKTTIFVMLVGCKVLMMMAVMGWQMRVTGLFSACREIKIKLQRRFSGRKIKDNAGNEHELKVGVKNVINKDTIPYLPLQFVFRFKASRHMKRLAVFEEVPFHEAEEFRERLMQKHLALYAKNGKK